MIPQSPPWLDVYFRLLTLHLYSIANSSFMKELTQVHVDVAFNQASAKVLLQGVENRALSKPRLDLHRK